MYSLLRLLLLLSFGTVVALSLGLGGEPATRPADAEKIIERFPIKKDNSSVLLPVTINGKHYRLCLDTGSPWTAYDKSLRHLLGKITARENFGTPDEPIMIPFFQPPDARLGKLALPKDSPVMDIDLTEHDKCSGEGWQGLLGIDFLKAHIFRIDFDRGEVVFLRAVGPDPGQRLALRLTNDQPQVKITLPGLKEPEWFVLDTGCVRGDGALWGCFRKPVFDALIKSGKLTSIQKQRQVRFAGERIYRFGWLDSLPFAGNTYKNLLFSEEDFSFLGLELLSRYVVTFDFPHQAVFLKKGRQFDRPYRQQLSGLGLERVKGQTVVESVVDGSPAAQAGIRSGDTLLQIDKQSIDGMTLFTLRNRLSEEGKRVQLTVRRGAQRLDMSLILSADNWKSEKREEEKGGRKGVGTRSH